MALTQTEKVFNFLKSGKTLTSAQAENKWGVQRLSARIFDLREEGHPIYSNPAVDSDGNSIVAYRMGTLTKAMKAQKRAGQTPRVCVS